MKVNVEVEHKLWLCESSGGLRAGSNRTNNTSRCSVLGGHAQDRDWLRQCQLRLLVVSYGFIILSTEQLPRFIHVPVLVTIPSSPTCITIFTSGSMCWEWCYWWIERLTFDLGQGGMCDRITASKNSIRMRLTTCMHRTDLEVWSKRMHLHYYQKYDLLESLRTRYIVHSIIWVPMNT